MCYENVIMSNIDVFDVWCLNQGHSYKPIYLLIFSSIHVCAMALGQNFVVYLFGGGGGEILN